MNDHLKETLIQIAHIRTNDIGCQLSIFYTMPDAVLESMDPADYINFSYEEVLINLFNHMCIQFEEEKTREWFRKQIAQWEMI